MRKVLVLALLIHILGCSEKEDEALSYKLQDFGPIYLLDQVDTLKVPPVIYKPMSMAVFKNNLFISDDADTILKIFTLPDCEFVGQYITRGRGPNEISAPRDLFPSKEFIAQSGLDGRILHVDIDDKKITIQKTTNLPSEHFDIFYLFHLADSCFYGTSQRFKGPGEFISFNSISNTVREDFAIKPKFIEEYPENSRWRISFGPVGVKSDFKKFARAYLLFPYIRIYDAQGNEDVLIAMTDKENFIGQNIIPLDELPFSRFTGRISTTDKYIFVEYKVVCSRKTYITSHILVIDWKGNAIKVLKFPGKDRLVLKPFTVSPDNKYLYTISDVVMDEIYRYKTGLN
jgi:hypothetical protein